MEMNKEKWIDEVLGSARQVTPVEGNPFLQTRVEAKLRQEKTIRPAWIYALTTAMSIALILNIYAWLNSRIETKPSGGIQGVMQEYGWSGNDNYSLNYSK